MKYCTKCGKQLTDSARFCSNCGNLTEKTASQTQNVTPHYAPRGRSGMATAAMILMILSTVSAGILIIPLAWYLPMTIYYCNRTKHGQDVGIGFKICTLLFVNTIAGILMLCDE